MSAELVLRPIHDERSYLAVVREIRTLVERIEDPREAKALADRARALQVWAERQRLGQQKVNLAIAARFWAARREGELLREMREHGERDAGGRGPIVESQRATQLLDLGIDKHESARVQALAAIPADVYADVIEDCIAAGRLNFAELERRVRRAERERADAEAERELLAELHERGGAHWHVEQADVRDFDPEGAVDAVVTDPPYITADAVELHAAVGEFAARTLKPDGALAMMTSQAILPEVLAALAETELRYRWTFAWVSGSHETTIDHPRRVYDGWKPVLIYHRGGWRQAPTARDVVRSARQPEKEQHPWQQTVESFRQLVRAVSRPGEVVCDPFAGSGTTGVAALAESRSFVGCDVDAAAVETARARLSGEVAA
jgi:hypothetical protein